MIRPFATGEPPPPLALSYETVLCTELPAFDPVPTLRSVLLKPPHLKRFEYFLRKTGWLTMPIYGCGLILRVVVCSAPAPLGRLLAPWAAILHIPPCIVFAAGIRVEFVKLILSAFDFWFPFAANTMFMIMFSIVLRDLRVLLVVLVWVAFGCSFLQETYFRDSRNIAMSAFVEAFLLVLLMGSISLNIMDEVYHTDLIVAGGHSLSTKDVLVNVIGTMATLMIRTMYRRLRLMKRQRKVKGTAVQSLGYRCFIALNPVGPGVSANNRVVPHPLGPMLFFSSKSMLVRKKTTRPCAGVMDSRHLSSLVLPPLQIHLVNDSRRHDPRDTLWRRVGSLDTLNGWQVSGLHLCAVTGFVLTVPSIFIPPSRASDAIGTLCLVTTALFHGVSMSCCQRVLLKRVGVSFDYLFLVLQLIAAHLCLADIFSWRWASTCGVAASYLWAQWTLTIDSLTPTMRQRLHVKSWMPTCCIVLFIVIQLLVLLDMMLLDFSKIRDRVFWDLEFLGRRAQFRVVTFLWSRVVTIFIWYGRLLYILVTRVHENTLIILRGNVEFDYHTWRLQANMARETRRRAKCVISPVNSTIPE
ncbi:hypothetical protein PF005_g16215 [Phytophthora fragariae]|uniref:Uncharacterized protein n=1 Tax=Phytophthora fragariae TaxID=53985 RepID=A0A6A3XA45_9STRA|nr:hypothetical protein PF003_g10612 [Phytophthora fragariae]KAE8931652.1 hypothetical protein PF009_g18294 [Phytophthora fragariae]KAE8995689.1 hypothetical protein PF011_g16215 [Phytophthora fragariae]KAE9070682.1 hypothetical protein PF010_g26172 [Phytophthora fragariae]KAE9095928.1 hypothetical protein PF007_g17203 [Phytophthora fragariae]